MTYRGRGGFATVMSARDSSRKNELVAIKKLCHETLRQQENNYSEIAFLKLCANHNNIVQYLKAWYHPEEKELWMVMEYLEGGTLHEAAHNHKFSENHVAYVGREVLKALKFLHSKELVHRDLKSQNIMLSINGVVKLIDFGLCAELSNGPRDSMVGSPFWMAPEMIKKQTHSYNVDIWSLGVCLLELLLMDPPHTVSGVKCMFLAATVGLQDQIPESAQPGAKAFLKRCLEMDPKKRPGSIELVEDPFVNRPGLSKGITEVLKDIFLTNTMTALGLDF